MDAMGTALNQQGIGYFVFSYVPTATESFADVMLDNRLPKGWMKSYTEQRFTADDPGFRYSQVTTMPFRWLKEAPHDPERDTRLAELVQFNRDFGLVDGVVIPVSKPPLRLGQVWFGGDEFDLPDRALPALNMMAMHAFDRVLQLKGVHYVPPGVLAPREREVLTLTALGKRADEIADALNLKTPTVRVYLDRCRSKLGAATIAQAVSIARGQHMIRP
ncbi:LuxR family transcriptional regulator [Bradyrhizobium septentrionale]|uniref:Autoinducer binding domain-containing protein n=1 Tax=Bradyrhizobium septentrionale TaxID=1404411 RepID=A0A973VZY3_9BRAD|nr:LuxR family transcriptional regulator [Bradyrhizobium septentrionale]UGY13722.1 LuxR family transcriptional regulator [Bradyrhizobium septentrionale]